MDVRQVSKNSNAQKKLISQIDKASKKSNSAGNGTGNTSSKKKKKSKKSSRNDKSSDKDGDQSPEIDKNSLEIEGVGVGDKTDGDSGIGHGTETGGEDSVSLAASEPCDSTATTNPKMVPPLQLEGLITNKNSANREDSNNTDNGQPAKSVKSVKSSKINRNSANTSGPKPLRNNTIAMATTGSCPANKSASAEQKILESLRWENILEDDAREEERLRLYKMNRRKRYLAAAQEKGLGWAANYSKNGLPMSEDASVDTQDKEVKRSCSSRSELSRNTSVTDFSAMKNLSPSQTLYSLQQATMLDC